MCYFSSTMATSCIMVYLASIMGYFVSIASSFASITAYFVQITSFVASFLGYVAEIAACFVSIPCYLVSTNLPQLWDRLLVLNSGLLCPNYALRCLKYGPLHPSKFWKASKGSAWPTWSCARARLVAHNRGYCQPIMHYFGV